MIATSNLGIELTQKCNLDCKHCFRGECKSTSITSKIIEKVFDEIKYAQVLDLSGGEPFLAYDELKMLLEIAKEKNVRIDFCSMLINGTIFDQRIYDILDAYFGKNYQIGISDDDFHDKAIYRRYGKNTINSKNPELFPATIEDVLNNQMKHIAHAQSIGFQRVSNRLIDNGRAKDSKTAKKQFEALGYYYSLMKSETNQDIHLVGPMIFIGAEGYISDINSDIERRNEQSIGHINNGRIIEQIINGSIKIECDNISDFILLMRQRENDFGLHQGDHLIFENNKMTHTVYEPDIEYEKTMLNAKKIFEEFRIASQKGIEGIREFLDTVELDDYPYDLTQIDHSIIENQVREYWEQNMLFKR